MAPGPCILDARGLLGPLEARIVATGGTEYNACMRAEELRALLRRRPFVPIRVHLTGGTTYDIKHPEMAFLTRSTVEIGLEEQPGSGIAVQVMDCSLLHVVRVENLDGQTTPMA